MNDETPLPQTADEVRARNAALDRELRALVARIPPALIHREPGEPGGEEWTLAQILAHLAEFPRYFASDLALQMEREGAVVGRTHAHPERLAAVASARGRTLEDLAAELDASLTALAAQLEPLRDEHLSRVAQHRRFGPQPLAAFLARHVLGHKAGHLQQLQDTLELVSMPSQ